SLRCVDSGRVGLEREAPLGEVAKQPRDRTRDGPPRGEDEPLSEALELGSGVGAAELVVGERWRDPEQTPRLGVDQVFDECPQPRRAWIDVVVTRQLRSIEELVSMAFECGRQLL